MSRLDKVGDVWNDLGFHGLENMYDNKKTFDLNSITKRICYKNLSKLLELSKFYIWNDLYSDLSRDEDKKFIIICHSIEELFFYKSLWSNAYTIYFENTFKFMNKYRKKYFKKNSNVELQSSNLLQYAYPIWKEYKVIKGTDWPKFPINRTDWENLSDNVIDEIKSFNPSLIHKIKNWLIIAKFYKDLQNDKKTFFWNVDNFLSIKKYLENLSILYSFLGLRNLNQDLVKIYHIEYLKKIEYLSKKQENNYYLMSIKQLCLQEEKLKKEISTRLKENDHMATMIRLKELETLLNCKQNITNRV